MPTKDLRGKIAIVGACETDRLGTLPGHSMITLHAEGIRNALDDAGLKLSDVDGLLCPGVPMTQLGEYLGITPRLYNNTQMGGCSFIAMVEHATLALDAGLINVAVISHGESGRSRIGVAPFGGAPASREASSRPPTAPSAHPQRSPYRPRATCTSTAPRWNNWRKCQSRPGSGPKCTPKP